MLFGLLLAGHLVGDFIVQTASRGAASGALLRSVDIPAEMLERIWLRVERTPTCWVWTGARTRKSNGDPGSGVIAWRAADRRPGRSTTIQVHRAVYAVCVGDVPAGLVVHRQCHNTICVRPAHLVLWTQGDSVADHLRTGHSPRWSVDLATVAAIRRSSALPYAELQVRYGLPHHALVKIVRNQTFHDPDYHPPAAKIRRGSATRDAKLTEADVLTIRRRHAAGAAVTSLAREYGIANSTAWEAIHGTTWTHVASA